MRISIIDRFQIAGFALSVIITLGLMLAGQNTETSVILGLILAILTQLFDLQMRLSNSEERLLQVNVLNQALYQDERLFKHVQQIVNDYLFIKQSWFDLFRRKAEDSLLDCRNTLHLLTEGNLTTSPKSPYTIGANAIEKYAEVSVKSISTANIGYWRSVYSEKYFEVMQRASQRNVKFIRIFLDKLDVLRDSVDIFDKHKNAGSEVYIAFVDEVPTNLIQDILIIDDRICGILELTNDGHVREQRITIDAVQIEQAVERFNQIMRFARKPEQINQP